MRSILAKGRQFLVQICVIALLVIASFELINIRHRNSSQQSYDNAKSDGPLTSMEKSGAQTEIADVEVPTESWKTTDVHIVQNVSELDPNGRYITGSFDISPGLGNLMFVYASVKAIGIRHEAQLIVPEDTALRRAFFDLDAVFVSREVLQQLMEKHEAEIHHLEACCKFYKDEITSLFVKRNFEMLDGYMQSYRYFHPYLARLIRSEFSFLPEVIARAKAYLEKIRRSKILKRDPKTRDQDDKLPQTYVGVHIRHGADITEENVHTKHGHKAAPEEYVLHAMDYFRNKYRKVIFVIVSDNEKWVRSVLDKINADDAFFVSTGFRETDMATLSLCNHTIMSTGTFSWWTAYLTAGTTVYYENWPRNGSELEGIVTKTDFFPPNWISMI